MKMWTKNTKQMLKKVEPDKDKLKKLENLPYMQFADMEDLNIMPLAAGTKNQPVEEWTIYQTEKYPRERLKEKAEKGHTNRAVICGKTSENLVIVDCDKPNLAEKIFGKDIKDRTFVVESGGDPKGRMHVYFKTDYPVRGRKFHKLRIEILGQGNYAVYPPSIHPLTDRKYKALKMTPIAHVEGDFIEEMYELLKNAFGSKFKPEDYRKSHDIDELIRGVKYGERDNAAIKIINWLRQAGVTEKNAEEYLFEWNEKNFIVDEKTGIKKPYPLPDDVIVDKVTRCYMRQEPYPYKFNRKYIPETTYPEHIRKKAEEILTKGDPFKAVNKATSVIHAGDKEMIQIIWLSAINSCVVDKIKINTWQIGRSQKGKSHSFYTVLHLLPPETYEVFTSSSPLAYFYYVKEYGEWSLDKKLIYIDEVEASKQALPMLRALTGQTNITPRHLTVHEAELLDLKIKGKRAVWFTSVQTFGTEQIKNRFIHLNPDETPEQDERVFDIEMDKYWENVEENDEPLLVMQAMSQNIIKNTQKLKVKKPFKPVWPFKSRRWLFPIFAGFVDTIAKIYYKQRKIKDNQIVATVGDVKKAKELWKTFQETIIFRVSHSAQTVYELLSPHKEEALTHAKIAEQVGQSTRNVRRLCKELLEEGLVNSEKGKTGWKYWKTKVPDFSAVGVVQKDRNDNNNNNNIQTDKRTQKKSKKVKTEKLVKNDVRMSDSNGKSIDSDWVERAAKAKKKAASGVYRD